MKSANQRQKIAYFMAFCRGFLLRFQITALFDPPSASVRHKHTVKT